MQSFTQRDEVIVYLIDLVSTPVQDWFSNLTAGEPETIVPSNAVGRKDPRLTRAVRRQVIGEFLGIEPNSIAFSAVNGKPDLAGYHDWFFNQSYSNSLMVIALAHMPVGVDVEWCKSDDNNAGVVDQFFHDEEIETLDQLSGQEKTDAFYRFWTRKEAVAKAAGFGTSMDFALLNTEGDSVTVRDPAFAHKSTVWHVTSHTIREHCTLAVATAVCPAGIDFRQWPGQGPTPKECR